MGMSRRAAPVGIVAAALAAALTIGSGACANSQRSAPNASSGANAVAPQPISCERWHLDYQPKLADQHVDCVLTLGNLTLEVSSDAAWSFAVHDRDTVVQQFREPADQVGQSGVAPLLRDIDHSGTPVGWTQRPPSRNCAHGPGARLSTGEAVDAAPPRRRFDGLFTAQCVA